MYVCIQSSLEGLYVALSPIAYEHRLFYEHVIPPPPNSATRRHCHCRLLAFLALENRHVFARRSRSARTSKGGAHTARPGTSVLRRAAFGKQPTIRIAKRSRFIPSNRTISVARFSRTISVARFNGTIAIGRFNPTIQQDIIIAERLR